MSFIAMFWYKNRISNELILVPFFFIQGADKLKKHLKPNETPVNVKEETQQNIRQVKTVAGRQYWEM